jgi:hypothetical protein
VGFLLFWLAWHLEQAPILFHVSMVATFTGGLGRTWSAARHGFEPMKGNIPIFIELGFPLICWAIYGSIRHDSRAGQPKLDSTPA